MSQPIKTETQKRYKLVMFYQRQHQPTFPSLAAAQRWIKARALVKNTACYTELWEMTDEDNGEMVALFDYGCTEPEKLVRL